MQVLESEISHKRLHDLDKQKKSWLEIVSKPAPRHQLSSHHLSDGSSDDTDGGGSGAHSSMMGPWNSRSTDRVGSICTGNSHSHIRCSSHTGKPDNQPQFRLKPARQNAAQGRKPIRLPSMQLTEVF